MNNHLNPFSVKGILLDIEGTTSSIRFVYDVMFPFVRRELDGFLQSHWPDANLQETCNLIAQDAGYETLASWSGNSTAEQQRTLVRDEVLGLMDDDVKATGLKKLQGMIWKAGFESGEMKAHLFDNVADAIKNWHEAGIDVRIYSSGSIQAQKLFFGHTLNGNLLPYLSGHYDTTTGPKREPESYTQIANHFGLAANDILFVSDIPEELDAASSAGMQVLLSVRPDNHPISDDVSYAKITSFAQIEIA